jgi:hypothetical protein
MTSTFDLVAKIQSVAKRRRVDIHQGGGVARAASSSEAMNNDSFSDKALRFTALAAAACVIGMIAIFFTTGVGQDPLQYVHPPDEYAALLLARPAALRAVIGLDDAFIVAYGAMYVLLARELLARGADRRIVRVALGFLFSVAVLDMAENFHFLTMLAGAEQGITPSRAEIAAQVWESLLKFHVSYIGMFVLGLALPRTTAAERALAFLCVFVQAPMGIAIYVTPHEVALPLVFGRFIYFLAALFLVAWIFPPRGSRASLAQHEAATSAPASLRGTTQGGAA